MTTPWLFNSFWLHQNRRHKLWSCPVLKHNKKTSIQTCGLKNQCNRNIQLCHIPAYDTWDSIIDTGKFVSMLYGKNCLNVRQGMAAGYSYPGNFENLISYNEVKTNLLG